MGSIETDYLVVGAGASGMAFTDALLDATSDADVVFVDRRHRPGGHWNDDYPFVRLHQPSALYGVASRTLGADRIDDSGPNAGYYERATAAELCDYYGRVLDEQMLPSGRVRFLGMHDYLGDEDDGYQVRSRVTGELTTVRVRRRLVDATYLESSIPATHAPGFTVDPDASLLTPNALVDLAEPANGFTVLGAGKTAMDTVCWLVGEGVDPESIRWVRPRDCWTSDRGSIQPLSLVAGFAAWVADQNEVCAEAGSIDELFPGLEARGVVQRLDPDVEPDFFRGATLSLAERATLRGIEDVVRLGKVRHVGADRIELDAGAIPNRAGHVVVDCTATGLACREDRPVFAPGSITLQWVQAGIAPFSAAVIGRVEGTRETDEAKNRLCPPSGYSPRADARSFAKGWHNTQSAFLTWFAEPDLAEWLDTCRLSILGNAAEYLTTAEAQTALGRMIAAQGPAVENLGRLLSAERTAA